MEVSRVARMRLPTGSGSCASGRRTDARRSRSAPEHRRRQRERMRLMVHMVPFIPPALPRMESATSLPVSTTIPLCSMLNVAQSAGAVDGGGLEDHHEDGRGGNGDGDLPTRPGTRRMHITITTMMGMSRAGGDHEGLAERVLNGLGDSRIVGAGVDVQAHDGVG